LIFNTPPPQTARPPSSAPPPPAAPAAALARSSSSRSSGSTVSPAAMTCRACVVCHPQTADGLRPSSSRMSGCARCRRCRRRCRSSWWRRRRGEVRRVMKCRLERRRQPPPLPQPFAWPFQCCDAALLVPKVWTAAVRIRQHNPARRQSGRRGRPSASSCRRRRSPAPTPTAAVAPCAGRGGRSQRGGGGGGQRGGGGGCASRATSGQRTGDQRQPRRHIHRIGPHAQLLVERPCSGASNGEDQRHLVRRGPRDHCVIPTTAPARLRKRLPCAAATPSPRAASR